MGILAQAGLSWRSLREFCSKGLEEAVTRGTQMKCVKLIFGHDSIGWMSEHHTGAGLRI